MKHGEIWTVSDSGDYAGKPRPAVIVQDDGYEALDSVTVCPFMRELATVPRPQIAPSESNGLREPSLLMVDKSSTVSKSELGHRLGRLSESDLSRLNRAMVVFLRIAARGR